MNNIEYTKRAAPPATRRAAPAAAWSSRPLHCCKEGALADPFGPLGWNTSYSCTILFETVELWAVNFSLALLIGLTMTFGLDPRSLMQYLCQKSNNTFNRLKVVELANHFGLLRACACRPNGLDASFSAQAVPPNPPPEKLPQPDGVFCFHEFWRKRIQSFCCERLCWLLFILFRFFVSLLCHCFKLTRAACLACLTQK